MPDAIGRFHWIVIDTVDPARIAPFWCALLGVRERGWFGDDYLMLTTDRGAPPVAFQRVPEAKSRRERAPNDYHLSPVRHSLRRTAERTVLPCCDSSINRKTRSSAFEAFSGSDVVLIVHISANVAHFAA